MPYQEKHEAKEGQVVPLHVWGIEWFVHHHHHEPLGESQHWQHHHHEHLRNQCQDQHH
jgi:hypothetical protein